MSGFSRDYHDFVFRDGQLVAQFEEMYRYSDGVPWRQDEQEDWIDIRLTVDVVRDLGPFDEIHDLGSGLGHYLALIHRKLARPGARGVGYDISETACARARATFPEFVFQQLDLMADTPEESEADSRVRRLFVIRGTLWYVFPKIGNVVRTIRRRMSSDDTLLVVQNFPPLDRPFVGKDVIPNHHALITHFTSAFVLLRHLWYEDAFKAANDNWFIGLFSVRA